MKKRFIVFILFFIIMIFSISCKEEKTYTVSYLCNEGGWISGGATQEVVLGQSANIVKAISDDNYHFIKWSDGLETEKRIEENVTADFEVTAIFERDDYHFPSFYIDTNNQPIISKDDYLNCKVTVDDVDNQEYSFINYEAKIKGRGNSTWGMPKKPYKLKFNEKVDLFGNGKAKTWTLIANYCDQSLSRNYLAYKIANLLETNKVTTSVKFIELYLNNVYQGVYLVCEQVEVNENRIDICDDYENANTGYLIELDYKVYEEPTILDEDYFLCDNIPYAIKYPEKEDIENIGIEKYVSYIKDYFNKCLTALKTKSFTEVEKLIDVDSFATGYIIQELFKNVDVKHSSFYFYKDKDGKLCNGPIWDMDITCGNCDYDNQVKIDYMYAKNKNIWYKLLLSFDEFQEIVKNKLMINYYDIMECINNNIDSLYQSKEYFVKNFTKWKILGVYTWPNPKVLVKLTTWDEHIEYVREWLINSLNYILDYYD